MKNYLHGVASVKKAVDSGETVFCDTDAYVVVKVLDEYYIKYLYGNSAIKLTSSDGLTLNGTNFYTKPKS